MTRTVVDTSALIALLYPDDEYNRRAATLLHETAEDGALLINSIVYAELAADDHFGSPEELDSFLADTGIELATVPREAQFVAGEAFRRYLERRGDGFQCSECGTETVFDCPACEATISARQRLASDFLIGAHAETEDRLLTFDRGFFRDYFEVECRSIKEES